MTALLLIGAGCRRAPDAEKIREMVRERSLGLAYLEENKPDSAAAAFRRLVELAPDEALGYADLALSYFRQQKLVEAGKWGKQALQKAGDVPEANLTLAEIYLAQNRLDEARRLLEKSAAGHPGHFRSHFKLSRLYARDPDTLPLAAKHLAEVVALRPANLAAQLMHLETLVQLGRHEDAVTRLHALRGRLPEIGEEAKNAFAATLVDLIAGHGKEAISGMRILHNLLKALPQYRADLIYLAGQGGRMAGFPLTDFSPEIRERISDELTVAAVVRFSAVDQEDAFDVRPSRSGSPRERSGIRLALGDYDGDRDTDLFIMGERVALFRNQAGRFVEVTRQAGLAQVSPGTIARFADIDNDGRLDLVVADGRGVRFYQNLDNARFATTSTAVRVPTGQKVQLARFVDFDHEGDLDLLVATHSGLRVFRNNSDGTFADVTARTFSKLPGPDCRDLAFADFDQDGDLDLFLTNALGANLLFSNERQGRFEDISAHSGFGDNRGATSVAAGDYNNDGAVDLFVTELSGGGSLYSNRRDGAFAKDLHADDAFAPFQTLVGLESRFFDFDNDGYLDLMVAGKARADSQRTVFLLRNDGRGGFDDMGSVMPFVNVTVDQIEPADYDGDGDLDLFLAGADGVRLYRNDGGNANRWLSVRLQGLRTGSGKNNVNGIGATVEVKSGALYQLRVVTDPVTHFGLGAHSTADVVRVVWTNGVPQNRLRLSSNQTIVEEQILKASCPFLYTWDGSRFRFVKDIMWRSAIGMPLGIMGGETAYAFPDASREFLKIPGRALKAVDGKYSLRITEELWETAYIDQVRLLAIDHPDSVRVYLDERFVLPPFPPLRVYQVSGRKRAQSIVDDKGADLKKQLAAADNYYAAGFARERYQGVTEWHDLIVDLGAAATPDSTLHLFLEGWLFPTDASINVAMSQSGKLQVKPPFLQVLDERGCWRTVIENIGFPMGKNKMVVVDLSGKFLSSRRLFRIRTNMEIYWDELFYSTDTVRVANVRTPIALASAELHYRGFSRMYRQRGPYSPHWFAYEDVTTQPRWRDLVGSYTRYGDVSPLLLTDDDQYIIMNSGDEISLEFDASTLSPPPNGWTRDFVIYTVGWIKDGDLNTGAGRTVEPLPFHQMTRYPYGRNEHFPDDQARQQYLRKYNTRKITNEAFLSIEAGLQNGGIQ